MSKHEASASCTSNRAPSEVLLFCQLLYHEIVGRTRCQNHSATAVVDCNALKDLYTKTLGKLVTKNVLFSLTKEIFPNCRWETASGSSDLVNLIVIDLSESSQMFAHSPPVSLHDIRRLIERLVHMGSDEIVHNQFDTTVINISGGLVSNSDSSKSTIRLGNKSVVQHQFTDDENSVRIEGPIHENLLLECSEDLEELARISFMESFLRFCPDSRNALLNAFQTYLDHSTIPSTYDSDISERNHQVSVADKKSTRWDNIVDKSSINGNEATRVKTQLCRLPVDALAEVLWKMGCRCLINRFIFYGFRAKIVSSSHLRLASRSNSHTSTVSPFISRPSEEASDSRMSGEFWPLNSLDSHRSLNTRIDDVLEGEAHLSLRNIAKIQKKLFKDGIFGADSMKDTWHSGDLSSESVSRPLRSHAKMDSLPYRIISSINNTDATFSEADCSRCSPCSKDLDSTVTADGCDFTPETSPYFIDSLNPNESQLVQRGLIDSLTSDKCRRSGSEETSDPARAFCFPNDVLHSRPMDKPKPLLPLSHAISRSHHHPLMYRNECEGFEGKSVLIDELTLSEWAYLLPTSSGLPMEGVSSPAIFPFQDNRKCGVCASQLDKSEQDVSKTSLLHREGTDDVVASSTLNDTGGCSVPVNNTTAHRSNVAPAPRNNKPQMSSAGAPSPLEGQSPRIAPHEQEILERFMAAFKGGLAGIYYLHHKEAECVMNAPSSARNGCGVTTIPSAGFGTAFSPRHSLPYSQLCLSARSARSSRQSSRSNSSRDFMGSSTTVSPSSEVADQSSTQENPVSQTRRQDLYIEIPPPPQTVEILTTPGEPLQWFVPIRDYPIDLLDDSYSQDANVQVEAFSDTHATYYPSLHARYRPYTSQEIGVFAEWRQRHPLNGYYAPNGRRPRAERHMSIQSFWENLTPKTEFSASPRSVTSSADSEFSFLCSTEVPPLDTLPNLFQ